MLKVGSTIKSSIGDLLAIPVDAALFCDACATGGKPAGGALTLGVVDVLGCTRRGLCGNTTIQGVVDVVAVEPLSTETTLPSAS